MKKKATKAKTTKANYGANENRRSCQNCGSTKSTVCTTNKTGRMIIRYRVCDDCGKRRATQEIVPMA